MALIGSSYFRDGDFYVPGKKMELAANTSRKFSCLVPGWYQCEVAGERVFLDGAPLSSGLLKLTKGGHLLQSIESPSKVTLRYDFAINKKYGESAVF
jgi:hypothetical protein